MLPLAEVKADLLSLLPKPLKVERQLAESAQYVLAEELVAKEPIPRFANSSMDGVAVRAADITQASPESPVTLALGKEIAAGAGAIEKVSSGEAAPIMTGAPLPEGTDCVVKIEDCVLKDGHVLVQVAVKPRNFVREVGSEITIGQSVFQPGMVLNPAALGVLASVGVVQVSVYKKPIVAVISTGNELVSPTKQPSGGQIRDSNQTSLVAALTTAGFETIGLGCIKDNEASVIEAVEDASERCDVIVTSGGVSMGTHDYVKSALASKGSLQWVQMAIKPGKPFVYGLYKSKPFFGLAGNPVSALVGAELLVIPALKQMAGYKHIDRLSVQAKAASAFPRPADTKVHYQRAQVSYVNGCFEAVRFDAQQSHQLSALAQSNALVRLEPCEKVVAGSTVEALLLGNVY